MSRHCEFWPLPLRRHLNLYVFASDLDIQYRAELDPDQETDKIRVVTQCYSSIEVSSNVVDIYKMTNGETVSFWESDGSARSHWIRQGKPVWRFYSKIPTCVWRLLQSSPHWHWGESVFIFPLISGWKWSRTWCWDVLPSLWLLMTTATCLSWCQLLLEKAAVHWRRSKTSASPVTSQATSLSWRMRTSHIPVSPGFSVCSTSWVTGIWCQKKKKRI